ncbi:phage virion morphogenesis protein [Bombella apis]|uniref:phage virion morphogenesis protein n=1 Tax=Bombella apis TaxID=1785988 RepID=UPI001D0F16B5|nr:phage virion morphogenesis protein [Bombella apis]
MIGGVVALIKITGTTNKISGALSRLQTLGKEPQEFLAALGLEMVDRTRQRIDDGVTPEGTPFAPLNPLYASGKPSGDPILKRSGSLRNELTSTIQGNSLVWGSNRIYAAVHQFGAIIKPVKAPALVFRMGGDLFKRQSVTIPARPYLGFTHEDRQAAVDTLETFFRRCMGG